MRLSCRVVSVHVLPDRSSSSVQQEATLYAGQLTSLCQQTLRLTTFKDGLMMASECEHRTPAKQHTCFVVHSCKVAWVWWPLTLKCPLGLMLLPESLSQSMSNFSGTAPSTDWLQEGNKSPLRAGAGIKMEFRLEINWFFSCGPYFLVLISIFM